MFLGQFACVLDPQQHITMPALFRKALTGSAYITQGFDRNLVILPERAFQVLYEQVAGLNIANPLARLLFRVVFGNASRLELDETGKVQIQDNLKKFAGIEETIILVGQGDYVEVWAASVWDQQQADLYDAEANAGRFAMFELALH